MNACRIFVRKPLGKRLLTYMTEQETFREEVFGRWGVDGSGPSPTAGFCTQHSSSVRVLII
jgi:hypothetical protein